MTTPQQRLAIAVKNRRVKLGLSVRAAAKAAGVDRNTWSSVEDSSRVLQDRNYGKFEAALQWPDGEIERVLGIKKLAPSSAPACSAEPRLSDEEIIAMDSRSLASWFIQLAASEGKDAAEDQLFRALDVRKKARAAERGTLATDA